jgi:CRP-like cAMP-binding protein
VHDNNDITTLRGQCSCKFSRGKRFGGLPDGLRPRILAGLGSEEFKVVLSIARHQTFTAPSVIVHQGDAAKRIFLLTSGQGVHFVINGDGHKILLHWLTAGQIFGGAAMLASPSQYLAGTEVQTDSCALVWNRQAFRELVSRFPVMLDNALSIAVTEHVAYQMAARISISTEDAPGRIARLLISLACGIGKDGDEGTEILVTNEDLARGTSLTPFTVSRVLAEWQRGGIVTKGRGKLILRRPGLLCQSDMSGSNRSIHSRFGTATTDAESNRLLYLFRRRRKSEVDSRYHRRMLMSGEQLWEPALCI